jgi:hypothetical protein
VYSADQQFTSREYVWSVRPSVCLCPSIRYQTVCKIPMYSVQDGLTKLYRTCTNFVPMGREKPELSFWQDMTHLVSIVTACHAVCVKYTAANLALCHRCNICSSFFVGRRRLTTKLCSFCSVLVTVVDSDTVPFLQYSPPSRSSYSFPQLIYFFLPLSLPLPPSLSLQVTCSLIHLLICNWLSSSHTAGVLTFTFYSFNFLPPLFTLPPLPKKGFAKRISIKHFNSESRRYRDSVSRKWTKFSKTWCVISAFGI